MVLAQFVKGRWLFGNIKPVPDQARAEIDRLIEETMTSWRSSVRSLVLVVLAISFSLYHLEAGFFGAPEAWLFRSTHLSVALVLCFLAFPATRARARRAWARYALGAYTFSCFALAVTAAVVVRATYPEVLWRGGLPNDLDRIMFGVLVFLVLEGCRRTLGMAITIVAAVFIAYAYLGAFAPGLLEHPGFSHDRITSIMYVQTEGLFAIPIAVTASYVMLFLLFAAFLVRSGAGSFFTDLAFGLSGRYTGGPAKASIWASCAMGSMSGSPIANVVSTGSITIPLMRKAGYRRSFAGAVEAVASTGGALTPPIMGAAAFIMAEYTRTSYGAIIGYAMWPALLYYISLTLIIHYEARRQGLRPQDPSTLPVVKDVLLRRGHLVLPIVLLVAFIVRGYTAPHAVSYALIAMVILAQLRPETRSNLRDCLAALELGTRMAIPTIMACAAAGVVVGTVTLTGLGIKLTALITAISGGNLLIALVFTMIVSLIMGMGMTTTSVYVVVAILCVPGLVGLGANLIAAHFFVLYFGMLSNITPPIALAAFGASSIAQSSPFRTSVEALRVGFPAFLLPYGFVYVPQLLLQGSWKGSVLAMIGSLVVVAVLGRLMSLIPSKSSSAAEG